MLLHSDVRTFPGCLSRYSETCRSKWTYSFLLSYFLSSISLFQRSFVVLMIRTPKFAAIDICIVVVPIQNAVEAWYLIPLRRFVATERFIHVERIQPAVEIRHLIKLPRFAATIRYFREIRLPNVVEQVYIDRKSKSVAVEGFTLMVCNLNAVQENFTIHKRTSAATASSV